MNPWRRKRLKSSAAEPDTQEMRAANGVRGAFIVIAIIVAGAAVAGAAVTAASIDEPLAYVRDGAGITQVLPVPLPTTVVPGGLPPITPTPQAFDVRAFLAGYTPGTRHDLIPHGVPSGYDWASRAVVGGIDPPSPDSGYMNLWGIVYTDLTDVRPANTRVNIANCQLWALPDASDTWRRLINDSPTHLGGGAWREEIRGDVAPFDLRTEADGTQSTATVAGRNSHFWAERPLVDVGSRYRAFVVTCSTRLILANPTQVDDRAQSRYIVALGADWRKSDHGCPVVEGITICDGLGTGRMVRVTPSWQRVAFTTISSTALATLPMPPADAFLNPDGTYGLG